MRDAVGRGSASLPCDGLPPLQPGTDEAADHAVQRFAVRLGDPVNLLVKGFVQPERDDFPLRFRGDRAVQS